MKGLIVTADDFGLAIPVNEAIEEAHRAGILTTASLMVGAAAAKDAIDRARRMPTLKVGLHLVLVEGRPVLSPKAVPSLVDERGEFSSRLFLAGLRFFFMPEVKRELEREVRAQFQAFRDTGLALDHVNAHNHMHLHPTVLGMILNIGKEFGLRSIRVPYEPLLPSLRASGRWSLSRIISWAMLWPWMVLLKHRTQVAGIASNDFVFGFYDTGHMKSDLIRRFIHSLPEGVTEIYCHPATRRSHETASTMPDYEHEEEFRALVSPAVKTALRSCAVQTVAFGDLSLSPWRTQCSKS
jgi:hopanoid biosynthesis associated protein HpnK